MEKKADTEQKLLENWKVLLAQHPVNGHRYVAGFKAGQ